MISKTLQSPPTADAPARPEEIATREHRPGRPIAASLLYDLIPIGALIRFSDGNQEPPAERRDDHAAWRLFNGTGRLAVKDPPPYSSVFAQSVNITLRTAEYGAQSAVGLTISLAGPFAGGMRFEVVELPPVGTVRILGKAGDNTELLHLATDHRGAIAWLAQHPVPTAIFDTVTADEIAAATVEGGSWTR